MKNNFDSAVSFLPGSLNKMLLNISDEIKEKTYEIRLRAGKCIALTTADGTIFADRDRFTYVYSEELHKVTVQEMRDSFNRLCNFSVYSHADSIAQGFITLSDGHRVGISGTAVTENGAIKSIRDVNSLNIRIAREFKGCADEIIEKVFCGGLNNLIVAGPPSSGKTTLLRDIARQVSSGRLSEYYKVAVVDERCEISPVSNGECKCDVGPNTDVLSSFRKADGIMCALRTLSPELIVCDEIGTSEECEAIKSGLNSGVNFALSIHAANVFELKNKPQFRILEQSGIDWKIIVLSSVPGKIKEIIEIGETDVQNDCPVSCGELLYPVRSVF